MKQKIFSLLALVMTVMTASAIDAPSYNLTVGTNAQGSVKFYVAETEVTKAEEGATVTVVITPNTGWVVNQPSGQWYAAVAKAPRRAQTGVDLLKDFELTKLLGQDNTWSFVMQRANAEVSVTYKKLLTNSDITIEDITALTYTGQAQEPVVTVKDGTAVLVKDVDYTVAYSNNTNAALSTATENAPTVTITAVATSDKYAGETTKTFTINKKALTVKAEDKSVTFGDDAPTYTESYDGFVNNETKTVLSGTLAFACDYVKNQTAAGTYDITPSGYTSSNYDITFTKGTLTVGKKTLEDGFIANIASLVYNGVAQEPAPVVTFNGMTLEKDVDYTVSYENNVNVGTATATVTALANSTKYSGSASKTFSITKKALTVKADNKKVTYGDDAPQYTVSYDGFVNNETKAVLSGTLALTCSYVKNQTAAGTYDITPSGYTSNNYDITFTKGTLTVGQKALESSMIAAIDPLKYTGNALTPEPVVTFNGMTLVNGTDYSVEYDNNTTPGTGTVTLTGIGNYAGTTTATFTIDKANAMVAFGIPYKFEKTYGDPNFTILPEVIGDGTLTYRSGNEKILTVDERTGEVTIIGVGKARVWAEMSDGDNYIADNDWYEVTVSPKALTEDMIGDIAGQNYTGEALTPEVVVSDGEAVLEESTDYTVAYSDNTDLGQATVTVTGTGNYTGNVTKTFDIAMAQLTLDEVNDNSAELLDADGKWFDVTLKRTLSAGSWNTFAVPFDIDTPDGWTVKSLESSSLEDGVLTLTFADAQGIEAGQPYLVKVEKDVDLSEQTFVGVKVSAESKPTETDGADLIPTLGKTAIEGEKESVLFLGAENKLYRPAELPADMKGFRAYFLLKGEAATAQEVRMDMGDATGITTTKYTNYTNDEFFDLSGRKVSKAVKGVYIVNGKRVVVK